MATRALTLDFETKPIGARGNADTNAGAYPPPPVGVAIKIGSGKGQYFAFGHPTDNNATLAKARRAVGDALNKTSALICHNLPFDMAVLNEHFGFDPATTHELIDTQVLAFLTDPYSQTLELKPLAMRYLGDAPDEQQAVRQWLVDQKIVNRTLKKSWAAQLWQAPGRLVGQYAIGDVDRTYKLFRLWRALLKTEGYRREMALQPVLIRMERRGVPINGARVKKDLARYEETLAANETVMRRLLAVSDLDFNKPNAVAAAMVDRFPDLIYKRTATGKISTARAALDDTLPDGVLKASMVFDSSLRQTLKMFLRPWAAQHARTPGRLHPQWNGTRNDKGGARTGRLSSTPNLQNLNDHEKELLLLKRIQMMARTRKWELPSLRDYVEAPAGLVLVGRDYSQVELRAAAHFEDGPMLEHYNLDPLWDLHQWVVDEIRTRYGRTITRRIAKNVGFGILYGAGGWAISAQSGLSYDDSMVIKNMYLDALPSLRDLMRDVSFRGKSGGTIKTIGGRIYSAQPAMITTDDAGELLAYRSFEYKLLNYLIQGSCADLMKQAMIEIDAAGVPLVMSVHDEPVALTERKAAADALATMSECMIKNDVARRFDVPLLTDGYIAKRWASKKKYE